MMGLHPITAGHGYTYLTRQVAASDGPAVAGGGIGAYYAEAVSHRPLARRRPRTLGIASGAAVSEAQMVALFGEGRHPDAAAIAAAVTASSARTAPTRSWSRGRWRRRLGWGGRSC